MKERKDPRAILKKCLTVRKILRTFPPAKERTRLGREEKGVVEGAGRGGENEHVSSTSSFHLRAERGGEKKTCAGTTHERGNQHK